MQNGYQQTAPKAPKKRRRKKQPQQQQGYYDDGYNQQYQQPPYPQQQVYQGQPHMGYNPQYQQQAYMDPRNQGRLDVAGAWLLMESYRAMTTKGKRRVVPILGLALVTVGTIKLTKWSGRKLVNGVNRTRNYLQRGRTDKEYNEHYGQQVDELEELTNKVQKEVVAPSQSVRAEVDMTGSDVHVKPLAHKVLDRINQEEGVFFRVTSNDKKPSKDKDGVVNPNFATNLKIALDGGEFITVENNGMYDKKGDLLIKGGALETSIYLLNRYSSKYEKGLLVLVDEFIKEGKLQG